MNPEKKIGDGRSLDLRGHEISPSLVITFPEDDHKENLSFHCNSFEEIDFILYRYALGTFLLFHFLKQVVFIELSKTKTDCSVEEIVSDECNEE